MGIVGFAINNPVKIAVGVILVVLFGLLSLTQVRIQLTPDVDRPVITVTTNWTGASPQEIETEIVDRQEKKLKNVSNLQKLTSSASNNQAKVKLEFPVGVDKDTAFRDVSDKLRQVTGYPIEVDEPVMSMTDNQMERTIAWMMLYAKSGEDVAPLKTFVEEHVKPILERAAGISEVSVYGGREREIQIEIDPYRLAARGLSFRDVEKALGRQNTNISAGTVSQGKHDTSYRTLGEFKSTDEITETVIAYRSGGPVLVRDVAKVVDGFKKQFSFVRSRGRDVLALPARRETGANVIEAMRNLKAQLEIVNREILAPRGLGLEMTQVYDETEYIWSAIFLVVKNLALGGLLAVAVLFIFLRSGGAVGIIAATIPISIVGTLLVITLVGRSVNVVLLAGMAFAVGMVVDNAIVVLENIYRHRAAGKDKKLAALDGTREVWGAVLASTLTTMAVFLPIITIQDEAGQLFKDIAIAIATAVGLSLVVSTLVIPPLASRFFHTRNAGGAAEKPWRLASGVSSLVRWINQRTSTRIVVVAGLSMASVLGSWLMAPATEYLPSGNKNLVMGLLFSPPGYSLEEFRRMAMIVEEGDPEDPNDGLRPFWEADLGTPEAANLPAVTMTLGKNKSDTRVVTPPPIRNFFFVSFDGGAFMGATSKVADNVRPLEGALTRAGGRVPGVFTLFNQASLFSSGSLRGGNTIDLELRGDSLPDVVAAAKLARRKVQQLGFGRPSATPANFSQGRPEIQVEPDRAKVADLGLDVRDVGFILRACVDGAYVGEFNDRGDKVDMALTVPDLGDVPLEQVVQVPIFTPSGNVVPMSSAVRVTRTTAPQQITHVEEMPSITLSVKPKLGVALQATMDQLQGEVIDPLRASGAIPTSVIVSLAGVADKLTQTRRSLLGDFRESLQRPSIFGLSVPSSIALLVGAVLVLVIGVWFGAGPRAAMTLAGGAAVLLPLAFLAFNLQFALALFESRAILALLVTYLLMAALFESFAYPFVIMFSVPLAAIGGFMALRVVHEVSLYDLTSPIQQLDVLTMLGFVILIGIVVNNAILIVHQALTYMRRDNMDSAAAVALSVQTRTRPIFMSALTSVIGMFPLVVMPGAGSELYRGLGSVVLGGLLVSTVFTLIVVPAMFTLMLDAQGWASARLRSSIPETMPAGASAAAAMPRSPDS